MTFLLSNFIVIAKRSWRKRPQALKRAVAAEAKYIEVTCAEVCEVAFTYIFLWVA